MIRTPGAPRAFRLLVPAGLLLLVGACAYYNTFFLARKSFSAAERSVAQSVLANPGGVEKVPADAERNYEIAIRQSKKVIQRHAGSRWADDAVFVLGASYYGLGDYDSALMSLGQLVEAFPKSGYRADAEFLIGMSHFKRREFDQSQVQFERVLSEYPKFKRRDEILFTQAETAASLRREEDAIRRYEALVREYPKSPRAAESLSRIGEIHFEEGRYDSSFIAFQRLRDLAKDDRARLASAVNEARALIELGRPDEALRLIEDVEPEEAAIVQTPGSATQQQQQERRTQDELGQNPTGYDPANMTQEQLLRNQTMQPQTAVRTGMDEEIAQLGLQKAAALNESKRHLEAIEILRNLTTRFANTNYAVEAQFQIGYTYETLLDSLESARTAYERAAGMSSRSIFRDQAAARSKALQSQIELEQRAGAEDAVMEERAAAALRLAEILLLDRELVDESVAKYREVEGQYPESKSAPRAAYALAYIRWKKMGDSLGARTDFRDLVARYPASRQARGAISVLVSQNADTSGLGGLLEAMAADTVAIPEAPESPAGVDSLGMPADSLAAPVDSLGGPDGLHGMSPLSRERLMEEEIAHGKGGPKRRSPMPPDPYGRELEPGPAVPDTADARHALADTSASPPRAPGVPVPAPADSAGAPSATTADTSAATPAPGAPGVPVPAPADTADTSSATGARP